MLAVVALAVVMMTTHQQQTPPPTVPDTSGLPLNLTITQLLLLMFGGLGLAALGKSVVAVVQGFAGMIKAFADHFPTRLEIDEKARQADVKAKEAAVKAEEVETANVEEVNKLFEQFRAELAKNQEATLRFGRIIRKTQRLSNEQREQFNEERKTWEAKMTQLVEEGKVKDVTLAAQAQQILKLQAENERLQERVVFLEGELKKRDTGPLDSSKVPDADPAHSPTPPPAPDAATDTP